MSVSFPTGWVSLMSLPREVALPALAFVWGGTAAIQLLETDLAAAAETTVMTAEADQFASGDAEVPRGLDPAAEQVAVAVAVADEPGVSEALGGGLRVSGGGTPGLLLAQAPDTAPISVGELPGAAPVVPLAPAPARVPAAAAGGAPARNTMSPAEMAAAAARAEATKFRFFFAPLRWSGNVSDTMTWTRTGDGPSSFRHVQFGNLRSATYLWQPWFAQVSANVGITTGTLSTSGDDALGETSSGGRDTTLTGGGSLSLFPASRFPFVATFDRTDSRLGGAVAVNNDFTTTRISLRQDYLPLRQPINYSASFDRSIVDAKNAGRDTVDAVRGAMSWSQEGQSASLVANHTANRGSANRFNFDSLNGRHYWQTNERLRLETQANVTRSETTLDQGASALGSANTNRTTTFDLSSVANWQPDTENPMLVTGNARLFNFANDSNGVESTARSLAAGLSASYTLNRNVSIFGNGQINHTRTDTGSDVIGQLGAGASYSSDPISLRDFLYTWSTSGSGSVEFGGADGNARTVTGTAGHNLNRTWKLSDRSDLAMGLSQNLNAINASNTGSTYSLGHTLSSSLSFRQSESFVTTVGAGAADTRVWGRSEGSFQSLSLQINGNLFINRYSSADASIIVQSTRQSSDEIVGNGGFSTNVAGTAAYRHARALGVAGLRYSLIYAGNTQQLNSRSQGNVDAPADRITHSLEQRLDYRIGRLDLQALFRLAQIDGGRNAFIFFSINREFGSF